MPFGQRQAREREARAVKDGAYMAKLDQRIEAYRLLPERQWFRVLTGDEADEAMRQIGEALNECYRVNQAHEEEHRAYRRKRQPIYTR